MTTTARPNTGTRHLPDRDELHWLLTHGETTGTLADRYHVTESTVKKALTGKANHR